MYTSAVVVAAGRGLRFRYKVPKPLIEIDSQPVIIYSLLTLSRHPEIKEIILVANRKNLKAIINKTKKYRIAKIKHIVLGGPKRQDSVKNGLGAICPKTELVLIHDGVRPFIDKKIVSSVIKEAKISGAAIVGVPVKATIKSVRCQVSGVRDRFIIEKTLSRDNLWEAQTPQVFKKDLIVKAYKKFGKMNVTDDAMLVEKLGAKVSIVPGSYNNIKITTPEDLIIARAIAKIWKAG